MALKWGILGCGDVAEYKGGPPLYNVEGSELVAVMRRDATKAESFAERHGAKRAYTNIEDLLADQEINAIYIATPPNLHCQQTIQVAEAGKHILCEKPMAMNTDECRQMIDVCQKNQVTLMIAYYRRFYPNILMMKKFLQANVIGETILARINHTSYYNPNRNEAGAWRTDQPSSGGGVLMDLGSHRIDLLIHLLGDIESVRGYADPLYCNSEVDHSAVFTLRFQTGAHATANINWNIGVPIDDIEIHGTDSLLRCNSLNSGNLTLENQDDIQDFTQKPLEYTHTGLIEDFVNHIRTGEPICCSGEEGLKTAEIISQLYNQD